MSWISTKINCKYCGHENNVAIQLPDCEVSSYPDKFTYAIADCDKNGDRFNINFKCQECGFRTDNTYSTKEFNEINYEYINC